MENPLLVAATNYESDAFPDNILRLEVREDGQSVYTAYNSKHEITAQSFYRRGKVARA